jgi:anti-sigma-K factor RskA
MSCDEIDALLAAYSLSALSPGEAEEVRRHLAGCRRHDEELAGLQAIAERLPLAAGEHEPTAGLRSRVLRAFDAEVAAREPPRAGVRWQYPARPAMAYLALAAVLVLAVIGLAAWNVVLQLDRDGDATVVAALVGTIGGGEVVYLPGEQVAIVKLDLPALPSGRAYQAWRLDDAGPVSLGLVTNEAMTAMSADLSGASAVAITEEPGGGSDQPTSDPLVVAQLP